ncbi:arylsulfatase [Allokutzneria albata]|uniref:Arylsulfatase n=1 Tax=Allokutzneria albata TaxID=211114 RepID=A0A1G9R617_ALLAB|nr:arylsulfatase [Allokutzneria albata]SDM18729.1 arylsulfatase [Allokutzneria albata]
MTDSTRHDVSPIQGRPRSGLSTPSRSSAGRPNVLIMLIEDVGFGAVSAFGGPCDTPRLDQLTVGGLRYNRFHTTALCPATRAALLTGRDHDHGGTGSATDTAASAPARPTVCASLPEILRLNGYSTARVGKCHEVPEWETGPVGPFDRWPTGSGFDYFYGFLGGETDRYHPANHRPVLYEGTSPVAPPKNRQGGYHLIEDLADRTIGWIRRQHALMPGKPFFMYFAPGATRAPHLVPQGWADCYRGRFDAGWDRLREEIFARQKAHGILPRDCEPDTRHSVIPKWEEVAEEMRPVLARQMELHAGFLSYTDHHVGRIVDALDELGILDDTLIYTIIGGNGASGEKVTTAGAGHAEREAFLRERLEEVGGPDSCDYYALGWAQAMNAPYEWEKRAPSHFGGARTGAIVHWPRGFESRGEIRSQVHHVIDVAPTVLEAAGLPEPVHVHGVRQRSMEGVSMAYSFDAPDAANRHEPEYFEMLGNRCIHDKVWAAVARHHSPRDAALPSFDDVWELYDTIADRTHAHDLAAEDPEEPHELQRLWLVETTGYTVPPLEARSVERLNTDGGGRPHLVRGERQLLFFGMGRLDERSVAPLKNTSHAVTAEIFVPAPGGDGVIIAQGGVTGGWSLYLRDGALGYCYNFYGLNRYYTVGGQPVPPGTHLVRMEFTYDGGGLAKGGDVALYLDDELVGTGRVERTEPYLVSAGENCYVGTETGSPVTADHRIPAFRGRVHWVQIDLGITDTGCGVYPCPSLS